MFDIDGTLVRTGGAGSRAMTRAFHDVFAVDHAFDGIPMAGRTDRGILHAALARARISTDDRGLSAFRERYYLHLREALPQAGTRNVVLPGVEQLLTTLANRSDTFVALLTGNCETGAQIKLEYFDLWKFFRCGAFGDDVHDRNELFSVAMTRAQACGAQALPPDRVLVVGDTELDVACAAAAGARAIAVATGTSTAADLRRSGADVVFEDLSETGAFLQLLG